MSFFKKLFRIKQHQPNESQPPPVNEQIEDPEKQLADIRQFVSNKTEMINLLASFPGVDPNDPCFNIYYNA